VHELIAQGIPYFFLLVLALVPVQVIIFLRKAAESNRFSQELLTALAIERLKAAREGEEEEGYDYDFYPFQSEPAARGTSWLAEYKKTVPAVALRRRGGGGRVRV